MNTHNVHLLTNSMLFKPEEYPLEILKANLHPSISLTAGDEIPPDKDIQVLVTGRPEKKHIDQCPHLQALVIPFAGIPEETLKLMKEYPSVAVYNLHYNASLVAEMAMALLLAAARFLLPCDRALRANDWDLRYNPPPAMMLDGKTVLILGFGEIGQRVGRVCHALGMRVWGIRRNPHKRAELDYPAEVFGLDALEDLLPHTHVLVVALPGTHETEGLVGEAQIRRMPPGSILVNVGRGAIVEQSALYHALKDGHLRAAGIDVWYNYPMHKKDRRNTPPADFPFGELDNIVMSPHRASFTTDSETVRMQHLAPLLNAIAAGTADAQRMNLDLGY